jgi:hypothetical protein
MPSQAVAAFRLFGESLTKAPFIFESGVSNGKEIHCLKNLLGFYLLKIPFRSIDHTLRQKE